jgi:hypothetical protein
MPCCENGEWGPKTEEQEQPLETGKGQETDSALVPPKKNNQPPDFWFSLLAIGKHP